MQREFSLAELNYCCWNLASKSGSPHSCHCFTMESELCQVFVPLSGRPSEVWLQTHLVEWDHQLAWAFSGSAMQDLLWPAGGTFGGIVANWLWWGPLTFSPGIGSLQHQGDLGVSLALASVGVKLGSELPPMALIFPLSFALVPFITARSPVPSTEIPSLAPPGQSELQNTNSFLFAFSACDSRA